MRNATMLAMQSVLPVLFAIDTVILIQNVAHLVQQDGPVKQMSLAQMNNVEVGSIVYKQNYWNTNDLFVFLGEGFIGITRCAEGLRCYARSKWYAHCAASCPGVDWAC